MIEIGGRPILWHIMKLYAAHGLTDFVICLGYKGYMIKEYFANFVLHNSDVTIDVIENRITYHHSEVEPWRDYARGYGRGDAHGRPTEARRAASCIRKSRSASPMATDYRM